MLRETDTETKKCNCESAWLTAHGFRGSQVPKQAHKGKITMAEVALSSLGKRSHC